MDDQGTEMVSFQLVAAAGEARSLAFEALEKAKAGDFDAAAKLMKQSKDAGIKAHHIQTQLRGGGRASVGGCVAGPCSGPPHVLHACSGARAGADLPV